MLSPSFGCLLVLFGVPLFVDASLRPLFHRHMMCVRVQISPLYKDISNFGLGVYFLQHDLNLTS